MRFKVRPVLSTLALALVQAAAHGQAPHPILPADQLATARAMQPMKAAQALNFLKAQNLGLGAEDGFQEVKVFTNTQGQTIARYQQTHGGYPVYGTAVTVRIDPDGTAHLLAQDVAAGIPSILVSNIKAEEAIQAAHRNLMPLGAYSGTPTAERVLFPTALAQGFQLIANEKGEPLINRDASLVGPRPTGAYTWAYRVRANFNNPQDGYREYNLIVSAETGQVLRKWDDAAGFVNQPPRAPQPTTYGTLAKLAASQPVIAAQPTAPKAAAARMVTAAQPWLSPTVPVKGWGRDQYLGLVSLDTAQAPDGSGYDLVDLTRTTKPHPVFGTLGNQTWYWDAWSVYSDQIPLTDYEFPYLSYGFYGSYSMDNKAWSAGGATGAGSVTNIWGDGENYLSPYNFKDGRITTVPQAITDFHYGDANGQTAAVGAHYATQMTYDMYKNVLGWLGVDGENSGTLSVVHDNLGGFDNAHFSYVDQMMHYGDGDWSATGGGYYKPFSTLAIGGHELSHGVMHALASVNYYGESMGLNEANSDILGTAAEAYARRTATDPLDRIPQGRIDYTIAREISANGTPLRWMHKPSKDGISVDSWYTGINNLDGHFTSGIANRFFYFLAEGASADPTSETYSAYLPQGMTGIGQDAAVRIWFKAMSEYMTPTTGIRSMRGPLLQAVADLYGADSTQGQAVANALAAVNVGAAYGSQGRPLVTLVNNLVAPDSPLGAIGLPTGSYRAAGIQFLYYTVPMVPMGEKTQLKVNVTNTTNPEVSWKAGWPLKIVPFPNLGGLDGTGAAGEAAANGSFDADGTYHAPLVGPKFCMTTATSKADPLEFAYMGVMAVQLDSDGDAENDAVDLGAFALCFNLPPYLVYQVNGGGQPTGLLFWYPGQQYIGYSFDDYTLQAWQEAFANAFVK